MTLGERIAALRKARGWTQEELAERIGVQRGYIALLEGGYRRNIRAELAIKLADAFGITVDDLLRPKADAATSGIVEAAPVVAA